MSERATSKQSRDARTLARKRNGDGQSRDGKADLGRTDFKRPNLDRPNFNRNVNLDTWQFVRVMVALEERGRRGALWRQWSTTWKSIDEELSALSDTDFDAYSELMMRHKLELQLPTVALKQELIANVRHVVKQLNDRLREKGQAPSQRQDLEFEASELKALLRELDPAASGAKGPKDKPGEALSQSQQDPKASNETKAPGSKSKHGKSGIDIQRAKGAGKGNSGGPAAGKRRVKRAR